MAVAPCDVWDPVSELLLLISTHSYEIQGALPWGLSEALRDLTVPVQLGWYFSRWMLLKILIGFIGRRGFYEQ